jgi:hypothetical protein
MKVREYESIPIEGNPCLLRGAKNTQEGKEQQYNKGTILGANNELKKASRTEDI